MILGWCNLTWICKYTKLYFSVSGITTITSTRECHMQATSYPSILSTSSREGHCVSTKGSDWSYVDEYFASNGKLPLQSYHYKHRRTDLYKYLNVFSSFFNPGCLKHKKQGKYFNTFSCYLFYIITQPCILLLLLFFNNIKL